MGPKFTDMGPGRLHVLIDGVFAIAVAVLYAGVLMLMGLSITASWRYLAGSPSSSCPRPGQRCALGRDARSWEPWRTFRRSFSRP